LDGHGLILSGCPSQALIVARICARFAWPSFGDFLGDLFPVNWYRYISINPDPYRVVPNLHDRQHDPITDHDFLVAFTIKDQHIS
jgi:hypothetical protein